MDVSKFTFFSPFAKGTYGANGAPLQVGNYIPTLTAGYTIGNNPPVGFVAGSSAFQATAYKDPATGRYVIAISGTNDIAGDLAADGALAGQDIGFSRWHAEMTDAIRFTQGVFERIRLELQQQGDLNPSLDDVRARVDITGHSLGGALAELTAKFYGLSGYNLDGPGVTNLVGNESWNAMQNEVRQQFPDLARSYDFASGQFSSDTFSVVGRAGTHLDGVAYWADPAAVDAFQEAVTLASGAALTGNLGSLFSGLGVASVRSQYRSQLENERVDTLALLNKSGQELEKSNVRAGQLEIRAPSSGVVKDIATTNAGAVVAAGVLLMNIVPKGEPLQAEVLLKNEDVGFVAVGQPVRLKVAAYQFQKYGLLEGKVNLVGADSADPKQQQQQGQPRTLTYRAIVRLDSTSLASAATGEKLALNPGMLVTAEIHQGRRSVLEYLLSPVKKVAQEAARER